MRFSRSALARLVWLSAMSALAACASLVPASAPPQIQHTPGAPVIVTDKTYDTGQFRLEFPRAWSIVKPSQAKDEHMQVYFLAPDGGYVIVHQVASVDSAAEEHRALANGVIVKVAVKAADQPSAQFAEQARQLISSIRG